MKLAFSNLAWDIRQDDAVLQYLSRKGFTGLEIAPTKLFGAAPYSCVADAVFYAKRVYEQYGLKICSMQSIWYGQSGNIWIESQRKELREYTYRAIDFAAAIGCENLVFGNPKVRNRIVPDQDLQIQSFFKDISTYARRQGTCVALEANPVIYGTNFINTTQEAFDYCDHCCDALKVNLDLGTMLYNEESLCVLDGQLGKVNHFHISEPYLAKIERRPVHSQLRSLDYEGYISVEMGAMEQLTDITDTIDYISEVLL